MGSTGYETSAPPPFLTKTYAQPSCSLAPVTLLTYLLLIRYDLVDDASTDAIVSWSPDGSRCALSNLCLGRSCNDTRQMSLQLHRLEATRVCQGSSTPTFQAQQLLQLRPPAQHLRMFTGPACAFFTFHPVFSVWTHSHALAHRDSEKLTLIGGNSRMTTSSATERTNSATSIVGNLPTHPRRSSSSSSSCCNLVSSRHSSQACLKASATQR
jgi:hypothetical protein